VGPERSSLSQKVARGGAWVFTLKIIEKIFGFTRLVILARLLAPNDFGLIGIALLTLSILDTFSETGYHTALIQKKKDISVYLDTAWTVSILRGFLLFIVIFFSAPYVSLFFKSAEASSVLKVLGLSILLRGFTNIGIVYFQKELEFNRQFVYGLIVTFADFIVAVLAALILKNMWALVFGHLAGNLAGVVASYLMHPYRPRINLDLAKIKELSGFGKWVFAYSILYFVITQGDDFFVGKVLGILALGFYQMAYKIANIPATEITNVISKVIFPAYAKMQVDIPRLRESFVRVVQFIAFISFPIAGLIFVLAPDFTKLFLGDKWMPMVQAMKVLVLWGLVRSLGTTTGTLLVSIDKPAIVTKLHFATLILLSGLIYPLSVKWGILGTSMAVFFATLVPNAAAFIIVIKIIRCEINNVTKMIVFPLLNTVFVILLISLVKSYCNNADALVFFFNIIMGLASYFFIAYVCDKFYDYRLMDNIKMNIHSLKNLQ
jgi:lipopolysaccharide exporter